MNCISGFPIYELTTTAEVADSTVALDILTKTHDFLPVSECTFLADKGYDIKNIYNQVCERYNGKCIIPLNRRNTKDSRLPPTGVTACEVGLVVNRDDRCYDRNRVKQKYCCPFKLSGICPIDHVKFHNGKKNRSYTKWITIPNDLRLLLDRNSKYYKPCYSLRTERERYNSRFKNTDQKRMWVRNLSSVANLNTIAHISLLVVAVASVAMPSSQSYRKLKAAKRTA